MSSPQACDVVVVGGGLAGMVAALGALRAGLSVTLVDRDAPERFGGLARWAFGGMALVGTPLQARMRIPRPPGDRAARLAAFWRARPRRSLVAGLGASITSSVRDRRFTTGCSARASSSCRR